MKFNQQEDGKFSITDIEEEDLININNCLKLPSTGAIQFSKLNNEKGISQFKETLNQFGYGPVIEGMTDEKIENWYQSELMVGLSATKFVDLCNELFDKVYGNH